MSSVIRIIILSCLFTVISARAAESNSVIDCESILSNNLIDEIKSYSPIVNKIISETVKGKFTRSTYNELAAFVDKFGNRLAGTENLENAIDYMLNISIAKNLENVHGEDVSVPFWKRGNESATMLEPRLQHLPMLGLGGSIGTSKEGITAEVLVVTSFDELNEMSEKVAGKIVVFVPEFVSYGVTVKYRQLAAAKAAAFGAVATLVRSVTPFSISSPHTGWQDYQENITKIPTACITVEDAHMIQRITSRGTKVVINIKMEAEPIVLKPSRNTVVEIKGYQKPNKVVIVSGHLDSWDVGQGAMDDGGGAFISWNSLVILKSLGLRPKRTLRAILWTGEELGLVGAFEYKKAHANESKDFTFMMESDEGTFNPLGLEYAAGEKGSCIVEQVVKLLKPIQATKSKKSGNIGSDITLWISEGIPGASFLNENQNYMWYHHSSGDTMDVEDPVNLDKCAALWASVAFVIADLTEDFPRD